MPSLKTSPAIARKASAVLRDEKPGKKAKSAAGSALSQTRANKTTSAKVARAAAKVLANPRASKAAKSVAASALSQKKPPFPVKSFRVSGSSLTQQRSAVVVRKILKKSQ